MPAKSARVRRANQIALAPDWLRCRGAEDGNHIDMQAVPSIQAGTHDMAVRHKGGWHSASTRKAELLFCTPGVTTVASGLDQQLASTGGAYGCTGTFRPRLAVVPRQMARPPCGATAAAPAAAMACQSGSALLEAQSPEFTIKWVGRRSLTGPVRPCGPGRPGRKRGHSWAWSGAPVAPQGLMPLLCFTAPALCCCSPLPRTSARWCAQSAGKLQVAGAQGLRPFR